MLLETQTAAEIIFQRANAQLPFMEMIHFKDSKPTKKEVSISKSYLTEEELKVLNRLVSAYLDIAEVNAMQHKAMYMKDWVEILDGFIKMSRQDVLTNAGKRSVELVKKKVETEYLQYKYKTADKLSEVEKQFIASIEQANKKLKRIKALSSKL